MRGDEPDFPEISGRGGMTMAVQSERAKRKGEGQVLPPFRREFVNKHDGRRFPLG